MKIVKFRAWDKENKRWVTPEIEDNEESELRLDIWGNLHFKSPWFEQESGTVTIVAGENVFDLSQYTGLKDKNGVEIYEGDIVHWMKEFISPMDMRTKHKIDGNRKVYQKESGEWVMGQGNGLHREVENIEVIGNIYENPELLEEEE